MSQSDEQLLDRMRSGEEAAFETLFLRHYGQVYRVMYNLVEGRDQAEVRRGCGRQAHKGFKKSDRELN